MHQPRRTALCCCGLLILWALPLAVGFGQGIDLEDRPIAAVRIEGLSQVDDQLVRNQLRLKPGDPYDADTAHGDVVRLTNLGRFSTVVTSAEPQADGSILLIYTLTEQPTISDVLFAGNKNLADQELARLVLLRTGDRVDSFLIDRGIRQIKDAYQEKGFFTTDVTIDQRRLDEEGILLFQIREGPRPHIRQIKFEGNTHFTDSQLASKIRSKTYIPIFRKGQLGREQLTFDAAVVKKFYEDGGYLDARVDGNAEISINEKDAIVTFLVDEGRQYIVASIEVRGNEIFADEQICGRMSLKVGDVFSTGRIKGSTEGLLDMYGKLGYIEAEVKIGHLFHEKEPKVDVVVTIDELMPYRVGKITIQGNQLTKQKVILRQVRGMRPGRPFDRTGIEKTRQRLAPSTLFDQARISVLGDPKDEVRDALIEVREQNTGSVSFGAGVSSDAGVAGEIGLTQRNFDIADYPESFGEFITGKSFRGAGQFFSMRAQPGNERSLYSVNFREPYIFDTEYFLDSSFFFFDRDRSDWVEQRFGTRLGVGQRFGDVYSASIRFRFENVNITDTDTTAPVDVSAVEGRSNIGSVGFTVSRNTTDARIFPSAGSITNVTLQRYGTLLGDYDFWKASLNFKKFWTVDEDFFGRRRVVSVRTEIGYIFDDDTINVGGQSVSEAPLFDRFYAGGHRTLRGFEFRGAGPRGNNLAGLATDRAVGGNFLFLLGAEYNVPIYQEVIRWVVFTDTGTLRKDLGLSQYRVSIGTGIRIKIPFLGQAPFAFDIAYPILKESSDREQFFSFDLDVPF